MNAKVKWVLIVAGKNAVNAILTNAGLITMFHSAFNWTTSNGWWNIGKATLSAIVAREAIVWVPKLIKWSTVTDDTEN